MAVNVNTATYMNARKRWARPEALLFADNSGTLSDGIWIPTGEEGTNFIIVSDHNRQPLSLTQTRIEDRKRMVNGTMRSYHTADKLTLSTSWNRLPSRSNSEAVAYDENTGLPITTGYTEYTADGGAGGVDLLSWYEDNPGAFWVYLSYDKFRINGTENYSTERLQSYTQVLQMYFASFDYTVEKRGGSNYDMWNVTLSLEEV
jgi:hypothetical protein